MGFPGAVEAHSPITAPNLGQAWTSTDVKARLAPFHKGRFAMLNDADAVAEAERRFGAGHADASCVLTLTVGTGLGTTLHQNGRLVPNLEYGRWPHPSRPGMLEEHLSGRARTAEGLSLEQWAVRFQEACRTSNLDFDPTGLCCTAASGALDALRSMLTTNAETVPAALTDTAGPLGAALAAVSAPHAL